MEKEESPLRSIHPVIVHGARENAAQVTDSGP
jgi:hypothetical protein